MSVTRFDDTVVYFGELTSDGLDHLKSTDRGTAKALLIRSGGGDVSVGMDFGDWVFERGLDVIVDEVCLSSCANYVFTAGRRKFILPGALVAWHGNTRQNSAVTTIDALPRAQQGQARKSLFEWRTREAAFYQKIGVSECLDRIGIDALGVHGLYTMSREDLGKFGVKDVSGAPVDESSISSRVRRELEFSFVTLPSTLDLGAACRKGSNR